MGSSASIQTTARSSIPNTILTQHQFLQNQNLAASFTTNRKIREILIRENGFSRTELTISEGETLWFSLRSRKLAPQTRRAIGNVNADDDDSTRAVEESQINDLSLLRRLEECSIVQVIVSDESSSTYKPVIGGYRYDRIGDEKVLMKFKLAGEYWFKLVNHPSNQNLPLLKVLVVPEEPLNLIITDDGFLPRIIRIDEGSTVRWTWNKLSHPHSIYEAEFCDGHSGLFQSSKELVTSALSNTYKKRFDEPGVYYFQTEAKNAEQKNVCIVEVQQSYREHIVEILDNKFSPALVTIDEGDLVWFTWSKDKCLKKHCVYQIHPPAPDHPEDQAYIAVNDGFRWSGPSRTGMMRHRFDKCGVYYFGDVSGNECASYIGVIAVKKKAAHQFVNYNEETKRFDKEIITADSGDIVWWRWNRSIGVTMNLVEATLLMDKKIDVFRCKSSTKGCQQLELNALSKTGIYSYKVKKPGCYYFHAFNGVEDFVMTVIALPAQRDHKIAITDEDARPSILSIHPEDRVWFAWNDTKRAHNVRQVTHSNQTIADGFISGSLMESPGAFVECFNNLGIFYYRSDSLKSLMGAIVVVPEPTIQVVHVSERGIDPDPMIIKVNDMIVWEFSSYQTSDVVQIKSEEDFYKYPDVGAKILPRRFLSRAFREPGAYHFASLSFDRTVDQSNVERSRGLDKTIISSILVDKLEDYEIVLVDSNGFHPFLINVEVGKSVLFDWRDTNESHNIVHVTHPSDKQPLRTIQDKSGFNSGKPVLNNSFLYTFEEEGAFCVISEGPMKSIAQSNDTTAQPYCIVHVLSAAQKAVTPRLANNEPFVMLKNHKVFLECDTPDVIIHYTTDGTMPNKLTQLYKREIGINLGEEGINIVRAIAYSERHLTSSIFTSPRFYVLGNAENVRTEYISTETNQILSVSNEEWWRCIPRIVINQFGVGCLEITWDKVNSQYMHMISHYKIFLNKVSYRRNISPNVNRVVAKGLASSRSYEITVMVYPKDKTLLPQQSNVVEVKTPKTTNLGGPVISLKANSIQDQITVTWLSIDSPNCPIDHYDLFVNEEKKETIKPAPGRHKIVIYGCVFEKKYSILVIAIPKDGTIALISNELEVKLPLGLDEIDLPDMDLRNLDSDYYDEYIEIVDALTGENDDDDVNETEVAASGEISSDEPRLKEERSGEPGVPKFAPYLSYDNYLIDNQLALVNSLKITKNVTKTSENKKPPLRQDSVVDLADSTSSTDRPLVEVKIEPNLDLVEDQNFDPNEKPQFIQVDENNLPVPQVVVSHLRTSTISVEWSMLKPTPPYLVLTHYVILLVGTDFGNIRSDASYECFVERDGQKLPAIQHSWIIKNTGEVDNKFVIEGIIDTAVYQVTLNAVFKLVDSTMFGEYKSSSKSIVFTPLGPPEPPRLRINAVDVQSATLEWIVPQYAKPEFISGYRLIVNSEPGQMFSRSDREFLFKDLQPGKSYRIEIATVTNSIVGQSKPSNAITIICPQRPKAPLITQLPTVRPYSAVIGWKPAEPKSSNKYDQILFYKVFVEQKYHGEIFCSNLNSYSYMVCDLAPGQSYDAMVQSFAGERLTHPVDAPFVSCLVASELSNILSITPSAPPEPVRLRVAAVCSDGLEVTWPFPQQYGDAVVSGFQLVRNGRCHGDIIPYDCSIYKLTDVELGQTVSLQMISLTNHPVGKYTALHEHPNYTMDQPQREELINSGLARSKSTLGYHPEYPACRPGPVLTVKFTGIAKPAVKVWTEKVTGYSALVFFQTTKMNSHFVEPEYYLVSYWPGVTPSDNIITIRTEHDYVELNNLKPSTIYTVQVESRRESRRTDDITAEESNADRVEYKFISYSKSNHLQFQTASPPDPPTNLSVVTTTCHAIKICWDPPIDHGSDIIATRVDCYPLNVEKPLLVYKELTPDTRSCIIDNLSEKTNYRICVTAITEEYMINHKIREQKQLPKLILESMPWLPTTHVDAMTSGTDPATDLEWKFKHDRSVACSWKQPKCYGTNRLVNQIVCYQEIIAGNVGTMATQIALPANAKGYKLTTLKIGSKYKIWIEAVVLIKLNIESSSDNQSQFKKLEDNFDYKNFKAEDHYKELKDSRCTNVLSEPIIVRVPAPCEPVVINLVSYSTDTIDLYWAKPSLYSQHRDPENPDKRVHLYRHLIGYRIEVNGIRQRSLGPKENFCTLTKCKPLGTYNIVVVAVTCLSSVAEHQDPLVESEIDINEIDESFSRPLQVKMFQAERDDRLTSFSARFEEGVDPREPRSVGRIRVEWELRQTGADMAQLNVNWFSAEESISQRKSLDPTARKCYIPVTKSKCMYEINMEVHFNGSSQPFVTERLFVEVPGAPDAPDLWLLEQKDTIATIQWSEPRVYPTVPIGGYQIYLDDVKVGAKIEKDILKATMPLKPNRNYKINVQALSSKPDQYADSILSNSVHLSTSLVNNLALVSNGNGTTTTTTVATTTTTTKLTGMDSTLEMLASRGGQQSGQLDPDLVSRFNLTQVMALTKFYEQENEREFGATDALIPLRFAKITEDYVDIDWSKWSGSGLSGVNEYKIQWHCLNTNEHFDHRCSPNMSTYRIKRLRAGFTYCIRVYAIKNTNTVVNRSRNFIVQMSAPPDAPILKLRACNFKYITMEWNRPMSYGEAPIVAYKIFIDGKVEAVLSSDQTVFTLSKGEPCHEYVFQIQALTSDESLTSPLSPALRVVWPGIKLPNLRAIESDKGNVRIAWDDPMISGNGKISFYRVIAESEDTGEQAIEGPFDTDIRECMLTGLNTSGRYKIYLEVNAHGSAEPFCSSPVYMDFGHRPDAPVLTAHVLGLDERKKLERIACSLCNKRDMLLRVITSVGEGEPGRRAGSGVPRAMATLRHLDESLNDCLKLLATYTGYFVVNLSWTCYQPNPMVRLLGFRVYVNDQQYGTELGEAIRNIRIKLSLEKAVHKIYVTAFTDNLSMESQISNVVEIMSENFFPFSFFCYSNAHSKEKSRGMLTWPEKNCCAYQETLPIERIQLSKTKEPINMGLLADPQSLPKCQLYDIISGKTRYLFDAKSKLSRTTVVLFWTKWCFSSIRFLNFLIMYVKKNLSEIEYITCHYGDENSSDLLELLKKGSYTDTNVKFLNDIQYSPKRENGEASVLETMGIKGVPLILIARNDKIVWKGRFCAFDYPHFECFMQHTLSECAQTRCPVLSCELCSEDVSIDTEIIDLRSEQKQLNQYADSFVRPSDAVSDYDPRLPRLPRIGAKQLMTVRTSGMNGGVGRSGAGAGAGGNKTTMGGGYGIMQPNISQVLNSYVIKKNGRAISSDGTYRMGHFKRN